MIRWATYLPAPGILRARKFCRSKTGVGLPALFERWARIRLARYPVAAVTFAVIIPMYVIAKVCEATASGLQVVASLIWRPLKRVQEADTEATIKYNKACGVERVESP